MIWNAFGQKAIEGDVDALGSLLESYRPLMKAIAERSLSPRLHVKADVSDIVQETFEHACLSIRTANALNGRQLWAWLRSLLLRRVCDVYRSYASCQKRSVDREVSSSDWQDVIHREQSTASEKLIRIESMERLHKTLLDLPRAYSTVLQLRYVEGLTCDDIAVLIDRTPDAVRMLVNRATACLKTRLTTLA